MKEWNFLSIEDKVKYLLLFVERNKRVPRPTEEVNGKLVGSFWKNIKNFDKNPRYKDVFEKFLQNNDILRYNYYYR